MEVKRVLTPPLPPLPGGLDPSKGSGTVRWSNHFLLPHPHHLVGPHWPSSGQGENRIHTVAKEPKLVGHALRASPLDPERTFYHLPCRAVVERVRNKSALNICSLSTPYTLLLEETSLKPPHP